MIVQLVSHRLTIYDGCWSLMMGTTCWWRINAYTQQYGWYVRACFKSSNPQDKIILAEASPWLGRGYQMWVYPFWLGTNKNSEVNAVSSTSNSLADTDDDRFVVQAVLPKLKLFSWDFNRIWLHPNGRWSLLWATMKEYPLRKETSNTDANWSWPEGPLPSSIVTSEIQKHVPTQPIFSSEDPIYAAVESKLKEAFSVKLLVAVNFEAKKTNDSELAETKSSIKWSSCRAWIFLWLTVSFASEVNPDQGRAVELMRGLFGLGCGRQCTDGL